MTWYRYTVWTWVTGSWHFCVATNDYGAAQQTIRALQAYGYNTSYQRAAIGSSQYLTPAWRVRLIWNGFVYDYGDASVGPWANQPTLDVMNALARFIPSSGLYGYELATGRWHGPVTGAAIAFATNLQQESRA